MRWIYYRGHNLCYEFITEGTIYAMNLLQRAQGESGISLGDVSVIQCRQISPDMFEAEGHLSSVGSTEWQVISTCYAWILYFIGIDYIQIFVTRRI